MPLPVEIALAGRCTQQAADDDIHSSRSNTAHTLSRGSGRPIVMSVAMPARSGMMQVGEQFE